MAKATKYIIPPVPVPDKFTVTLELTQSEAETLKGVTGFIGGPDGSGTLRRNMMNIGRALYQAEVSEGFGEDDVEPSNRAIYFRH